MAEEKSTTTLNKMRVEQLLSYIAQTFYKISDNDTQQSLFEDWKQQMFKGKEVPLLGNDKKIELAYFPDYVLSRMVFGGTVNGQDLATVSENFKASYPKSDSRYSKYYQTDDTILLSTENSYDFEGVFFLAEDVTNIKANGILDSLKDSDGRNPIQVGDWVVSIGSKWTKIDNTDAVRTVLNLTGNITAKDIRDLAFAVETELSGAMWYKDGDVMKAIATSAFGRSLLNAIANQSFTGLIAEKATKLETPRTIWGNSFDGSENIGGNIEPLEDSVRSIGSTTKRFRNAYLYGYIYMGSGHESGGIYVSRTKIGFHNKNNELTKDIFSFNSLGDTTVGYKLLVNGATTLQSTLSVVGATTLQDTLNVGKLATLDSLKVNNETTLGSNISTSKLTVDAVSTFNGDVTVADGKQTILGGTLQVRQGASLLSTLNVKEATTLQDILNVSGVTTLNSTLNVGANILPLSDNTIDIGSSDKRIRDVFLSRYIFLNTNAEGIYVAGTEINWHDDTNSYKKTLLSFTAEGLVQVANDFSVVGNSNLQGSLQVNGATTLNSTLLVKDLATFEKNILLANTNVVAFKHTDGQSNINLLSLTQNNEALFGYGTIAKGLTSTLYGKKIQFKTKDSLDNDAIIDENGNFHSYHDISAAGGVSASGINDFGIGGGSVGAGGKTYEFTKVDEVTKIILELTATDGSQKETVALNQFSNAFAGLVPATNGASKTTVLSTEGWRILTANDIPNLDWSKITTGKPTTLVGYGITDAYTKSEIENGIFPNMRVGLADDLGDIEETLDEEYTFQPTANPNEIRDGYAQIESLKGNSLVWNQLFSSIESHETSGITFTNNGDGTYTINGTTTEIFRSNGSDYGREFRQIKGHKYLFIATEEVAVQGYTVSLSIIYHNNIIIANTNGYQKVNFYIRSGITFNNVTFTPQLIDLTQMFGKGYEPTTVEEFERRCPKGMPMDYNEGEVIHFNGDIKSVGFNQWDEEWELGYFAPSDGLERVATDRIRSKNYIPALPNVDYYVNTSARELYVFCYDSNKNYIGLAKNGTTTNVVNLNFLPMPNTAFIKFYVYQSTYNHDICINLSDPDKNGTYEPYTEFRRDLPTELFEGGMKSAGTAHDEIYWDKAKGKYIKVTRIGEVDLGTLEWIYNIESSTGNTFVARKTDDMPLPNIANSVKNYVCAKYNSQTANEMYGVYKGLDKVVFIEDGNKFKINDSAYTDAESFTASLQGVMLYYELAEPIIEEIDIPYMDYQVSNDGTEEIVSEVPTTPIKARVTYNFDTIGTVRQNRFDISNIKDFISLININLLAHSNELGVINTAIINLQGATTDLGKSINNTNKTISLLAKGEGVSGNWVLDGLKIGEYDVLHKGNTSLVIDSGDNFGFTLKVADSEIQMSDITEDELRQMINTAWGTNYEA